MILKVVIRNLLKHPFLNLVKIIGLSLALTGIAFIALFLNYELNFDRYHTKSDRIYRYTFTNSRFMGGKHFARVINPAYIPEIKEKEAGVENYVRLRPIRGGLIKHGERFYGINQAFECDSTFFHVFDAEMVIGSKHTVLENPASVVISQSFAKKVFSNSDPVGQVLTLPAGQYYDNSQDFTVGGIMKDFPPNSHFHPDFIATPVEAQANFGWGWTYLLLAENANARNVETGITNYLKSIMGNNPDDVDTRVYLQKITDIHLNSHKLREIEPNGELRNVYVLAIAVFILLLISIGNNANLNIGMAGFSAKYLFVNKLMGSSGKSTAGYFFTEGLLIVLLTIAFTLILSIPVNSLIVKFYSLNLLKGNTGLIFFIILGFSVIALASGMLPVIKPVLSPERLSGGSNHSLQLKRGKVSNVLIIAQYSFSIALIIAVIVITRQTNYAINHSLGAKKANIICMESVHSSLQQKFGIFKEELLKYNSIESVSAMLEPPGGEANDMFPFEMEGYQPENPDNQHDIIGVFPCDYSFASLFNLQFLSGENFSEKNNDAEGSGEYIINEAAMHRLGYSNPDEITGKEFKLNFMSPGIDIPRGTITGVVKNFHLESLKSAVEPLVLFKRDKLWLLNFVISYKPGMRDVALSHIKEVWASLFPGYPFQYEHVGAMYKKVYKAELLQGRLLSVFTIIALFICSMGLFAIALISTQQRVKEIGVRKVNGARVSEIIRMLNSAYILKVAIAFLIACPLAWLTMDKWLENFAYKTSLSWWIFALAGVLALGIALLTVSIQSWKAATRNPVEALRYE